MSNVFQPFNGLTPPGVASGPFSPFPAPAPVGLTARLAASTPASWATPSGLAPMSIPELQASAAGGGGGLQGLLGRFAYTGPGAGGAATTGRLATAASKYGPTAALVTQGQIVPSWLNKTFADAPSSSVQGASRDVLGNMSGAAALSAPAWLLGPEVGAPVTAAFAAGGALKAVAEDIFGSPDEGPGDMRQTLTDYAKQAGVDPSGYLSRFDLLTKTGMPTTDKDGNVTGTTKDPQQIAQTLGGQIEQDAAQTQAQLRSDLQQRLLHEQDLQYTLAAQTQARDYFAPYINQMVSAGQAQHDTLMKLADQAPSEYRGVFQAQAANALNTSQATAGAYAGQIALMPTMEVMDAYDKRRQAETQNTADIYRAALQLKSQSGSGQTDFSQLGE